MKKVSRLSILIASLSMATGVITFINAKNKVDPEHDGIDDVVDTFVPEYKNIKLNKLVTPSDNYYSTQKNYSMNIIGDIEPVWDTYTGAGTKIAIIDDGFDTNHAEYKRSDGTSAILSNSAFFKSSGTYYVTVSQTLYSADSTCLDQEWDAEQNKWATHGTNSSTTAAAPKGNSGIVGIAPDADLLLIKTDMLLTSIDKAIRYAADQGCDVINMSLGAYAESFTDGYGQVYTTGTPKTGEKQVYASTATALESACTYAHNKNSIIVAAAGNEATSVHSYPACNSYVIGVGALGQNLAGKLAKFSNHNKSETESGNKNVDILAPGYVYAAGKGGTKTSPTHTYNNNQGTSFSSPIVAGAAALWKQKYPNGTPDQFEERLLTTAAGIDTYKDAKITPVSTEIDVNISGGRLDVGALMGLGTDVSGITLSETSKNLYTSGSYTSNTSFEISANVTPSSALNQNIIWSTTNSNIAKLSKTSSLSGEIIKVTAGSTVGTATIKAKSEDGGFEASCIVTTSKYVPVTGFSIKDANGNTSGTIKKGETIQLIPSITPSNASNKEVIYVPDDESIVSVDDDTGIVTGLKVGSTDIYALCGNEELDDVYSITVEEAESAGNIFVDCYDKNTVSDSSSTNAWSLDSFKDRVTLNNTTNNSILTGITQDKAYKRKGGIALGSSSKKGDITFTFDSTYKIDKVTLIGTHWDSNNSSTITLADKDGSGSLNPAGTEPSKCDKSIVFENLGGISSFKVYSPNRAIVYSLDCELVGGGGNTPATQNYTVSFNSNGGTGSMNNATTNGSTYVVPTCEFTKSGCTFDKWALDSATGTKYSAGETISNISKNITLYATWKENQTTGGGDTGEYQYYSGNYYSSITSTQISTGGTTLISALKTLIQPKTAFGYGNIWTFNENNDKYPSNYDGTDPLTGNTYPTTNNTQKRGKMWDMYSDQTWTGSSQRCGSYSTIGDAYNREHSLPKSWFGGSESNQPGTDPNHLFNTDGKVNGMRSNYPYGEVVKDITFDGYTFEGKNATGFGKLGKNSSGAIVFEPDDAYKGDFARAQMYMATAYYDWNLTQDTYGASCFSYANGVSTMKSYYIDLLTKWSAEDPVSQKEIDRNNAVYNSTQKNRNPFIDHPTWANKIWGGTTYTWNGKSSEDETINVTSVSLNKTNETISVGEELTLIPTIAPDNASNKSVTWSSSNETVATVNNGVVTGVSAGESTITVTTVDGNKTATCLIKVETQGSSDAVTASIDFTQSNSTDEDNIGNTWTGAGGVSGGYYRLDNTKTITSSTILMDTSKTIDLVLYIGSYGSGTKTLSVYAINSSKTMVTNTINMSPTSTGSNKFTGTLNFTNTSDSNIQIVFKTTSGSIRFYKGDITYTPLAVEPKVTELLLDQTELSFDLYNDFSPKTIIATVTADEGADETVTWTSDNETVATVEGGIVTPHAKGTATIAAKAGDIEKTCSVTVNDSTPAAVSGITLDENNISLTVGQTTTLTATVLPSNAGNKNISWSTSNSSIATVDNGFVTTLAVGTVYITATTEEGGFTATCTITVSAAPVITYELVADQTVFSYMSGTNHTVSVGVKLYQYTNGENGNQVASGISTVDTSSLGQQDISFAYQSTTYTTKVKVTNDGAENNVGVSSQGTSKKDTLNASMLKATGTTYTGFSGVSDANGSGAAYSGASAKDNSGNIQLRSKSSDSGIFQTTTGGKVTSIKITVGSGSNTINVYGKDSPYSAVGDLFDTSKQGTLIGSLSATGTLTFTTDKQYGYIGIRSNSGAIYLSSIEITCGSAGASYPATPKDQAIAWADYFIRETRTDETCKASTDAAKLAGLQSKWATLADEYDWMVSGAKDEFCASTDPKIVEAREHYKYIVSKFGVSNLGSDGAFVTNGSGVSLSTKTNNVMPLFNMSNQTSIIIVISFMGITSIGLYFFIKKRKEIE